MNAQPAEFDVVWVDLTVAVAPPAGVRASRFSEAGKTVSRLVRSSVAPGPDGKIRSTGRSDFALLDRTMQVGVFLDFMDHPDPHWHLSMSAVSGSRGEHRAAVSVQEITAWVQAGFPTATRFRTYTLATGVARHAEVTIATSGESNN